MAITKNPGRQEVVHAHVDFAFGDLTSGADAPAIELPSGAVVIGGDVVVSTAWNSVTSDTLAVGDSASNNRYKTAFSIAATGLTAIVPTGKEYTTKDNVTVRWTGVGTAPSTGAARLRISYYVKNKASHSVGMKARADGTLA